MTIGFLFWLLMIIWLVFGVFNNRAQFTAGNYIGIGGSLLEFILFFLLGWACFGFIVHG
jgi:hypothetical protein